MGVTTVIDGVCPSGRGNRTSTIDLNVFGIKSHGFSALHRDVLLIQVYKAFGFVFHMDLIFFALDVDDPTIIVLDS
jgi:hypothetical protein